MGPITDIFRQHGATYLRRHHGRILPGHRRTIHDICLCRTPSMGGHVYQCSHVPEIAERRIGREQSTMEQIDEYASNSHINLDPYAQSR